MTFFTTVCTWVGFLVLYLAFAVLLGRFLSWTSRTTDRREEVFEGKLVPFPLQQKGSEKDVS